MKKAVIILAAVLVIVLGATAYAADTSSVDNSGGMGFGRIMGQRGYTFMSDLLKNKFGISSTDIEKGREDGKTMYDIASDKGISTDQFKQTMLEERYKAIDKAVADGTITKDQGDAMKERIKNNSQNCTPGQGPRQGMGRNGFGRGNCSIQ